MARHQLYSSFSNNPYRGLGYGADTGKPLTIPEAHIVGPDQHAAIPFHNKYVGYTLAAGTFDNDFTWCNTTKTNVANKGGGITVTPSGLTAYVSGTAYVSIFGNEMSVNVDVNINPYSTAIDGLTLVGRGFVSVSENKGLANEGIFANLPIDSESFPFQVSFKIGRYDLGSGYETTWTTEFTLPMEPTGDIQPDTIMFNMGIYFGVYYNSGDLVVWPIDMVDVIVSEKFDKPGGEDIGYHKTKSNSNNQSSGPSPNETTEDQTSSDNNSTPPDPTSGRGKFTF